MEGLSAELEGGHEHLQAILNIEVIANVFVLLQSRLELSRVLLCQLMETPLPLLRLRVNGWRGLVLLALEEIKQEIDVLLALEEFRVAHDVPDLLLVFPVVLSHLGHLLNLLLLGV